MDKRMGKYLWARVILLSEDHHYRIQNGVLQWYYIQDMIQK